MTDATATGPAIEPRGGWFQRHGRTLAVIAFLVALAGALALFVAAFGYRFGWVPLRLALQTLLPAGAILAGVGAVLCLLVTILLIALAGNGRRGLIISCLGIVVGAVAFYLPYSLAHGAKDTPPIHDISTDTANPPQFVDAVPLRKAAHATNPTEYKIQGGRAPKIVNVPEAQHRAFPDIQPVILDGVAPADAFKRALDTVHKMGWHLTAARPAEGRIEAWDQTFWFGFIDDIVIRVAPTGKGSRIDVRSVSRIGVGDAGTNARRIRRYIAALTKSGSD